MVELIQSEPHHWIFLLDISSGGWVASFVAPWLRRLEQSG